MFEHIAHGATLYAQMMGQALVVYVAFLGIEKLWPAERAQPLRDWWFNIRYQAFSYYFVLLFIYPALAALTIGALKRAHPAWFGFIKVDGRVDAALSLILFFFIYDFFYYWFHRWQHKWPLLWEQHKLHHSEESLNATTAMRHHWLEEMLRIFFISIPMAVAFDLTPITAGWLGAALAYWPYFIHANVRLPLGGLTRVVVGPQAHRIHHSLEDAHADRNFAAVFPLWDILFGTFCAPRAGEYPRTGLHSGERVTSFWQANLLPFAGWRRMWRERRQRLRARHALANRVENDVANRVGNDVVCATDRSADFR
jgi:sterol desaturase/sphingolipid hydroxylase (fatty acid hydroxylase superfamily)